MVPDPASGGDLQTPEARARAWENEIAERVARYRRRRGGASRAADLEDNLEFDFDATGGGDEDGGAVSDREELDLVLDNERESEHEAPLLDLIPIQRGGGAAGLRPEDAVEWALEPSDFRVASPEPVEIFLDSSPEDEQPEIIAAGRRHLAAPISLRFAAGIIDGLILLLSATVFALVFWKSGGQLNFGRHAEDVTSLLVLAVLAAFFMVFYFGLFTALAFATPGQSAMGLEVRTLDDELPDGRAARRRALGYLVSTVALMLGFIWAIFDVDGLAWHDRVSGTCLARQRS
jgi:uncharacterized RDD family membrane protein YckC